MSAYFKKPTVSLLKRCVRECQLQAKGARSPRDVVVLRRLERQFEAELARLKRRLPRTGSIRP